MKIILTNKEPGLNPTSDELAKVIISRVGLEPRKTGSTEQMHKVFIELYEKSKLANREKRPESAVMTVEEMAVFAGITRQTMYDYLKRWLELNLIIKTSYIKDGKVIIGYKLNGATIESAFEKSILKIQNELDITKKYVSELQRILKNEKISQKQKENVEFEQKDVAYD
ncbi:hypothetical protein KY308_03165 [Candidatus Woesearchaeota archaeon]|nr:hypothetical protein [Candidatus Woesearchaeota archaeon]